MPLLHFTAEHLLYIPPVTVVWWRSTAQTEACATARYTHAVIKELLSNIQACKHTQYININIKDLRNHFPSYP